MKQDKNNILLLVISVPKYLDQSVRDVAKHAYYTRITIVVQLYYNSITIVLQ